MDRRIVTEQEVDEALKLPLQRVYAAMGFKQMRQTARVLERGIFKMTATTDLDVARTGDTIHIPEIKINQFREDDEPPPTEQELRAFVRGRMQSSRDDEWELKEQERAREELRSLLGRTT